LYFLISIISSALALCDLFFIRINHRRNTAKLFFVSDNSFSVHAHGSGNYQDRLQTIIRTGNETDSKHRYEASLFLDNKNPFDCLAVKIDINGSTIGYLSRLDARAYRQELSRLELGAADHGCAAIIIGDRGHGRRHGVYSVRLDLSIRQLDYQN
jgi:hypothetical protein